MPAMETFQRNGFIIVSAFQIFNENNHLKTQIRIIWVMTPYSPIGWFTNILKEAAASFFMVKNVILFRFVSFEVTVYSQV
jgi:hypothetical protein